MRKTLLAVALLLSGCASVCANTVTYTYSQMSAGLCGFGYPSGGSIYFANTETVWAGWMTGTSASMIASGSGNPAWVSVDGGAYTGPALSGGSLPLFSDLSDTAHFVQILVNGSYTPNTGFGLSTSGVVFTISGAAPALENLGDHSAMWEITDPAFPGEFLGRTSPVGTATYCQMPSTCIPLNSPSASMPVLLPQNPIAPRCQNTVMTAFKGRGAELWIKCSNNAPYAAGGSCVWYSIDGGSPTDSGVTPIQPVSGGPDTYASQWYRIASGLDTTKDHIYRIHDRNSGYYDTARNCVTAVAIRTPGGMGVMGVLPAMPKIIQFGDSVTFGASAPNVEACYVGAYLGALAVNSGVSGQTTAQIKARLASDYAAYGVAFDHIILAAGRNNAKDATFQSDYQTLIAAALATGCPSVICRPVETFPSAGTNPWNSWIKAAVAAVNDPRVYFVDADYATSVTPNWVTSIASADSTHPSIYGYSQLGRLIRRDYWDRVNGGLIAAPAGDGIPNLIKYALGIGAYTPGYQGNYSTGVVTVGGSNYLTMTHTRPEPAPWGVTYIPESSPDLSAGSWSDTSPTLISTTASLSGNLSEVTVRDTIPIGTSPRRFLRLRLTSGPVLPVTYSYSSGFENSAYSGSDTTLNFTDPTSLGVWATASTNGTLSAILNACSSQANPAGGSGNHIRLLDASTTQNIYTYFDTCANTTGTDSQSLRISFNFAVTASSGNGMNGLAFGDFPANPFAAYGNDWVAIQSGRHSGSVTSAYRAIYLYYDTAPRSGGTSVNAHKADGNYYTFVPGSYVEISYQINPVTFQYQSVKVDGVEQLGVATASGVNPGMPAVAYAPMTAGTTQPQSYFRMFSASSGTGTYDVDNIVISLTTP